MKRSNKYIKKYLVLIWKAGKGMVLFSALLMVLRSFLDVLLPWLIQELIDKGIIASNIDNIIMFSLLYIIIMGGDNLIGFCYNQFNSRLKLRVSSILKMDFIKHLLRSNGKSISNQNSGDIIHILDSDVHQLETFGIDMVFELGMNICVAAAALYIMIRISVLLLIVTVIVQLCLCCVQYFLSKKVANSVRKVREIAGKQSALEEQFIGNIKNTVLTNVTDYFYKLYKDYQDELVNKSNEVNRLIFIHSGISATLYSFCSILTYWLGGIFVINNRISMGELLAFSQYCALLMAPFRFYAGYNIKLKQSAVSLEKIYSEFERIEEIESDINGIQCEQAIYSLEFHNVKFAYRQKNILDNFSFCFIKDQVTVIVGKSGSGKSTLLNLIYRLWEPDEGFITLNGIPLNKYNLKEVRRKICIVCQDSFIFNKNIRENICLDNLVISENTLCKAYVAIGIDQLLGKNITEKTLLGESGCNISGGQKQRIALARAILRDSDVLILDECTSALDNISQKHIIENMQPYWKNKIVIIIAHRLSIAKVADQVLVLDDGKVVEYGGYENLVQRKGIFYSMLNASNSLEGIN